GDPRLRSMRQKSVGEIDAVHSGHGDVGQECVDGVLRRADAERSFAARDRDHTISRFEERVADKIANAMIVVDDQDGFLARTHWRALLAVQDRSVLSHDIDVAAAARPDAIEVLHRIAGLAGPSLAAVARMENGAFVPDDVHVASSAAPYRFEIA